MTSALTLSQFLACVRSPQPSREGKDGVSSLSPPQAHSSLHGNGSRGSDMLWEVSDLCYFNSLVASNGAGASASICRTRPIGHSCFAPERDHWTPNRSPSASRELRLVRTPSAPAPPHGPVAAEHRSQPPWLPLPRLS